MSIDTPTHIPIRPPTHDEGLPRAVAISGVSVATAEDLDAVPEAREFEDTGAVVTRLTGMMQAQPGGEAPQLTPEALITELMKHAVAKVGGGGGDGSPPTKTFLGSDARGWGNWMLKYALAGALAVFAWYTWVNDSIEDRPTYEESATIAAEAVEAVIEATDHTIDDHQARETHEKTEEVLEAHAAQLKKLGDMQIQQTTILKGQGEDLKDIKQDLRYLSGRSRRDRRDED